MQQEDYADLTCYTCGRPLDIERSDGSAEPENPEELTCYTCGRPLDADDAEGEDA